MPAPGSRAPVPAAPANSVPRAPGRTSWSPTSTSVSPPSRDPTAQSSAVEWFRRPGCSWRAPGAPYRFTIRCTDRHRGAYRRRAPAAAKCRWRRMAQSPPVYPSAALPSAVWCRPPVVTAWAARPAWKRSRTVLRARAYPPGVFPAFASVRASRRPRAWWRVSSVLPCSGSRRSRTARGRAGHRPGRGTASLSVRRIARVGHAAVCSRCSRPGGESHRGTAPVWLAMCPVALARPRRLAPVMSQRTHPRLWSTKATRLAGHFTPERQRRQFRGSIDHRTYPPSIVRRRSRKHHPPSVANSTAPRDASWLHCSPAAAGPSQHRWRGRLCRQTTKLPAAPPGRVLVLRRCPCTPAHGPPKARTTAL